MTASLRFVLDAQSKAALPAFSNTPLEFEAGHAVPATGDAVTLGAISGHSFVVTERQFAFAQDGEATVICHLSLASERSI